MRTDFLKIVGLVIFEDVTEALWVTKVSSGTISNINKNVYKSIDKWRNRAIKGSQPYVCLDDIVLKRSWAGAIKNEFILVAIGVSQDGYRKVLGIIEGAKEDKSGWRNFLAHLKERGIKGVKLIISDACMGLVELASEFFPDADWQRFTVHFYRNIFSVVLRSKVRDVADMLKAIHASEDLEAALQKTELVIEKLKKMKLKEAAKKVPDSIQETLTYYRYPQSHWRRIRANNPMERLMWEIRRRTKVVGAFPDGNSALMLFAARLRHVSATLWGTQKYLSMDLLKYQELATTLSS